MQNCRVGLRGFWRRWRVWRVAVVACTVLVACGASDVGDTAGVSPEPTTGLTPVSPSEPDAAPATTVVPEPNPTETVTPASTPTVVQAVPLAINHLQVLGSHNSYHVVPPEPLFAAITALSPELAASREYSHWSLAEQLETFGIRQLELDVYADPEGGLFSSPAANPLVGLPPLEAPSLAEPGFKVLHVQDYDYSTTCLTLIVCLEEVDLWSRLRPRHLPVLVMIEVKSESVPDAAAAEGFDLSVELPWTIPRAPSRELVTSLDAEIRSVFDADRLITPDDVRGSSATLEAAVLDRGWPTLEESRGKIMFALTGNSVREFYVDGTPSLEGRVMFTNAEPGQPDAAFLSIDDPADGRLDDLVAVGYLVRTRTDVPTSDARANDTTRRDTALAGGGHFLSTDFYTPSEFFPSSYVVELPDKLVARCNPISAPPACSDDQLTEPG